MSRNESRRQATNNTGVMEPEGRPNASLAQNENRRFGLLLLDL
jgi:hypothetical protein